MSVVCKDQQGGKEGRLMTEKLEIRTTVEGKVDPASVSYILLAFQNVRGRVLRYYGDKSLLSVGSLT